MSAQESNDFATLTLQNNEHIKISPDELVLTIYVRAWNKDFGKASSHMEENVLLAKNILVDEGVDPNEIKTTHVNIQKSYEYKNGKSIENGFNANSGIKTRMPIDLEKMSIILEKFADASPDFSVNYGFAISDDLQENATTELVQDALKKAKHKASKMASSLDKEVVDIWKISYSENNDPIYPQPRLRHMEVMATSADQPKSEFVENIEEIQLSVSVHTVWKLK